MPSFVWLSFILAGISAFIRTDVQGLKCLLRLLLPLTQRESKMIGKNSLMNRIFTFI